MTVRIFIGPEADSAHTEKFDPTPDPNRHRPTDLPQMVVVGQAAIYTAEHDHVAGTEVLSLPTGHIGSTAIGASHFHTAA